MNINIPKRKTLVFDTSLLKGIRPDSGQLAPYEEADDEENPKKRRRIFAYSPRVLTLGRHSLEIVPSRVRLSDVDYRPVPTPQTLSSDAYVDKMSNRGLR